MKGLQLMSLWLEMLDYSSEVVDVIIWQRLQALISVTHTADMDF